jgi:hypothetical protein
MAFRDGWRRIELVATVICILLTLVAASVGIERYNKGIISWHGSHYFIIKIWLAFFVMRLARWVIEGFISNNGEKDES